MLAEPAIGAVEGTALTKFCEVLAEILPTGVGDVTGPAGATDGNLPVFDGASGVLLADSGFSVADILSYVVSSVAAAKYPTIVVVSASTLTLGSSHVGAVIECTNAAGCNITIDHGVLAASEWFEAYATLGQVTFTQGTSLTADKPTSLSRKTREAFSTARLTARIVTSSTTSLLTGDLEVT